MDNFRSLGGYENEWRARKPASPTREDVEHEVMEREARSREWKAAAGARKQERAKLTDEQRLEKLEAWMDFTRFGSPANVDREKAEADLRYTYSVALNDWEREDPNKFEMPRDAFRSGVPSVVDGVFAARRFAPRR